MLKLDSKKVAELFNITLRPDYEFCSSILQDPADPVIQPHLCSVNSIFKSRCLLLSHNIYSAAVLQVAA